MRPKISFIIEMDRVVLEERNEAEEIFEHRIPSILLWKSDIDV